MIIGKNGKRKYRTIGEKQVKMSWGHFRNQQDNIHYSFKCVEMKTLLKRNLGDTLLVQRCLENCLLRILFIVLSHLGTHRLLQSWIKAAYLMLKVAVDLGIVHMVLVTHECRKHLGHWGFRQISKEGLVGQTTCSRVRIPLAVSEGVIHEAVRRKLKLVWRCQGLRVASDMVYVPKKVAGCESC